MAGSGLLNNYRPYWSRLREDAVGGAGAELPRLLDGLQELGIQHDAARRDAEGLNALTFSTMAAPLRLRRTGRRNPSSRVTGSVLPRLGIFRSASSGPVQAMK